MPVVNEAVDEAPSSPKIISSVVSTSRPLVEGVKSSPVVSDDVSTVSVPGTLPVSSANLHLSSSASVGSRPPLLGPRPLLGSRSRPLLGARPTSTSSLPVDVPSSPEGVQSDT